MSGSKHSINDYLAAGFSSDNCCSYAISLAAARRGLSVEWLGEPFFKHLKIPVNNANQLGNLYRISDGRRRLLFNKTLPLMTPTSVLAAVKDKFGCASQLAAVGVATTHPELYDLSDKKSAKRLIANANYPLVLKPFKGSMGKGVFANIETKRELKGVIKQCSGRVVCEHYLQGNEYRIYVLGGQPIAAVRRHAPSILGDGQSTLSELITRANTERKRRRLPALKTDDATELKLAKLKLTLQSVPQAGAQVILSDKLGRSSGGLIETVGLDELPALDSFCQSIQNAFPELSLYAADVIDTGRDLAVIEINTRPQISSLLNPDSGAAFDFADAFVTHFFGSELPCVDVPAPAATTLLSPLKRGDVRVGFTASTVSGDAPVIAEPDARLLHNQGNIHQLILQRAAWQRGAVVATFKNAQGYARWSITGRQRALRFRQNMPSTTSLKTRQITNDKFATKQKLQAADIATPNGSKFKATNSEEVLRWYQQLDGNTRVVVKPIDGAGGKGVTSNIQSAEELLAALRYARSDWVVVEEHVSGQDYRLICSGGRFLAAIHRLPASVQGDGQSNIEQLIAAKNAARQANPYLKKCVIKYDEAMAYRLKKNDYSLASVLPAGEHLYLNDIANITAGGDSVDITESVHADFKRLAESAQLAFPDLSYCGVDILAADIGQPLSGQRAAIIEVNANCDVALHHFPSVGQPRDAAGEIIADLFDATDNKVCSELIRVTGKVTGVGFRKWAARRCAALGLNASIRNNVNVVEIRARGSVASLTQLRSELINGSKRSVPTMVNSYPLPQLELPAGVQVVTA